ncbi:MAG: hypothetical protein L0Z53_09380 [Acidobacteriales bacterium]|nr:hypothetical protein [Terriglobales bacterium]
MNQRATIDDGVNKMERLANSAKVLIGAVTLGGVAVLVRGLWDWTQFDAVRFASFLVIAVLAALFKVKLPGMNSSMSVNLPFILLAVAELSLPEALIVGCASTLAQCLRIAQNRRNPVQIVFNVCTVANAVALAWFVFNRQHPGSNAPLHTLMLGLAAAAFMLANTVPVAAILSATAGNNVVKIWGRMFLLTFPYYLLSAAVTAIMSAAGHYVGWQAPLLALPVMYAVYSSYRHYFLAHAEANVARVSVAVAGD